MSSKFQVASGFRNRSGCRRATRNVSVREEEMQCAGIVLKNTKKSRTELPNSFRIIVQDCPVFGHDGQVSKHGGCNNRPVSRIPVLPLQQDIFNPDFFIHGDNFDTAQRFETVHISGQTVADFQHTLLHLYPNFPYGNGRYKGSVLRNPVAHFSSFVRQTIRFKRPPEQCACIEQNQDHAPHSSVSGSITESSM